MSENTKPNNERPADLAVQDSVGGMARRLLNPAHLRDLAGRSVKTLREQGAEQLWRDVKFRVGLAMHHDDWRHRADIPLRRELKAQRAAHLQGPKISIIVPLYNTPAKLFDEMLQSVVRQTYTNWELVLVDASDADKRLERRLSNAVPGFPSVSLFSTFVISNETVLSFAVNSAVRTASICFSSFFTVISYVALSPLIVAFTSPLESFTSVPLIRTVLIAEV